MASKARGDWCAAPNCHNSRKKGIRCFSFPKDEERCKKWVQNCRREDLVGKPVAYLHANCCVCSEHFEASQFMDHTRKNCRLIWKAVPTLFNVPNPPPRLTIKRPLPTRSELPPAKKARRQKATSTCDAGAAGSCPANTMEPGASHSSQEISTPLAEEIVVKLELPWSLKEEGQDQPCNPVQPLAVDSPAQPMSDGSLLSLSAGHVCQRCSAVFTLSRSLQVHMETFHGETQRSWMPAASGPHEKMPSGQERVSVLITEDARTSSVTTSGDFVIKLEPPWSLKEEGQDQPSAVYSPVQPSAVNNPVEPSAVYSPVQPSAVNNPVEPSAVDNPAQPMFDRSLLSLNTGHMCQRCSAAFILFSSLELHMVTFHGETLQDLFAMYSAYQCYLAGNHPESKMDSVDNCKKKAAKRGQDKGQDTEGTAWENKNKEHVCDVCGKKFTKAFHLKTHKMIHTGHRSFVCDVCGKAFTRADSLKTHKLIHTGHKPFVCDICTKAFTLPGNLKTHKLIHTGQKQFVCDVCNKAFSVAGNLKTHKLIHTAQKPFVCDVCSKSFVHECLLKTHKLIHSGNKPFVCDLCGKAFSRAGDLKKHKLIHTGLKPFMCEVCSKAFTQVSHLKEHKLIHGGCKTFVCDICSRAFAHSTTLKQHKMIHTGHKAFVCNVCSKAFTYSSSLSQHKSVHSKHKAFVCDVCSKVFTEAASLKRHKLIHSGRKLFVCDICSQVYCHSSSLKQHKLIHSGLKPFVCDVCGKAFTRSSTWKKHKRVHTEKRT